MGENDKDEEEVEEEGVEEVEEVEQVEELEGILPESLKMLQFFKHALIIV